LEEGYPVGYPDARQSETGEDSVRRNLEISKYRHTITAGISIKAGCANTRNLTGWGHRRFSKIAPNGARDIATYFNIACAYSLTELPKHIIT
jgi:hypothetical protein